MKQWTRWQDWVAVAAGAYAALSTLWTTQSGASTIFMITLGVLLVIAGVWNLAMPRLVSTEWVEAILGAVLFLAPWLGGYAAQAGAAWTSWICGAIALIAGLWAVVPAMRTHQEAHP
jgi:hypothetical protein